MFSFIQINGKKVTIPSFQVHMDDEITIKTSKQQKGLFIEMESRLQKQQTPKWLHLDISSRKGKVVSYPEGDDLHQPFDPTLIVELYSR